ncbi:SDR family NAD(P)-dependent oxidoreductase [Streptococcus mutans]|uniref:SDR family NAD(P)-dependent oxidoreductase n=1 Tax=Streptococcus mutans TaxID=1309 RepID=UPI0038BCC2FE
MLRKIIICDLESQLGQETNSDIKFIKSNENAVDDIYTDIVSQLSIYINHELNIKQNQEVFFQLVIIASQEKNKLVEGITSLLKTINQEIRGCSYQSIYIEEDYKSLKEILKIVDNDYLRVGDAEILYSKGRRFVKEISKLRAYDNISKNNVIKENGIYLIVGGAGGVGKLFAEYICNKVNSCTIYLVGRSDLSNKIKKFIAQNKTKSTISYLNLDITDINETQKVINSIVSRHGVINGIFHFAGIIKDKLFSKKNVEDFKEVMSPKVQGVVNLDNCTKNINLDFMIFSSSIVSEIGNIGQSDYAVANSFLNNYSVYRNNLVKQGLRFGKTITIAWPIWKNGGMKINPELMEDIQKNIGIFPMSDALGLQAFDDILSCKQDTVIVAYGDQNKITKQFETNSFGNRKLEFVNNNKVNKEVIPKTQQISSSISDLVTDVVQKVTLLDRAQLTENINFDSLGINSIQIVEIDKLIREQFEQLNISLVNCNSISEICKLLEEKRGAPLINFERNTLSDTTIYSISEKLSDKGDDIVIVGMSGRFPGSKNIKEFEDNLMRGDFQVSSAPQNRWDSSYYYSRLKQVDLYDKIPHTTYGFFLEDALKFDSTFFKVPPINAQYIDPQERLFMEEGIKAIIDAGLINSKYCKENTDKVGVYGALNQKGFSKWHPLNMSSQANFVNRFSYFMNFKGPSVSFDTACSSFFSALNQAKNDLEKKLIDIAIVGTANLYLHPDDYISLFNGKMITSNSNIKILSEGSNGFIPSEAVGALILSRREIAKQNKSHIYATLKNIKVNHSGNTKNYGVPNTIEQKDIILNTMNQVNINPTDLNHIETSMNGLRKGDISEFEAINSVFDKSAISLGAMKSVVGNSEAASGFGQIVKSILQIKNRKLFPNNFSEKILKDNNLNYIEELQSVTINKPLLIGINSFGATGIYAHAILEEETENSFQFPESTIYSFIFSSHSKETLRLLLEDWSVYLDSLGKVNLASISEMLKNRRQKSMYTITFEAKTKEELIEKIKNNIALSDNTFNKYVINEHQEEQDNPIFNYDVVPYLPTYEFDRIFYEIPKALDSSNGDHENIFDEEEVFMPMNGNLFMNSNLDEELLQHKLISILKTQLFLDDDFKIIGDTTFDELGADSVLLEKISIAINEEIGVNISPITFFNYPSISSLASHLHYLLCNK